MQETFWRPILNDKFDNIKCGVNKWKQVESKTEKKVK